jgi:RNA polymerase sigma factor (TIGR02999 family)
MADRDESSEKRELGTRPAAGSLEAAVYAELRGLARSLLRGEHEPRVDATSLLHEAFVRLRDHPHFDPADRPRFFAMAADAIRHVLVDQARRRAAGKRGGGWRSITLSDVRMAGDDAVEIDVEALDIALVRLASLSPRQARVVELRFFGGLDVAEIARELAVSERTIKTDWQMARAWLRREMKRLGGDQR